MKPIHKFNGGKGATLCHKCKKIIIESITDYLYCDSCSLQINKNMIILTRTNDGKVINGEKFAWIEWNDNGTFKAKHDDINIGYSLIIDPYFTSFTWLTTPITGIIEQSENHIKFTTENSEYTLTIN